MRKEFIDPGKTLVEAASDWLVARAETVAEGAKSLERLLVIVPTAQSGRSLRLALARKAAERGWGGIMPPAISMPDLLLVDDSARTATEAEELAAMAELLMAADLDGFDALFPKKPADKSVEWALATAKSLLGIESILGEGALTMADVDAEEDKDRWKDLAAVEERFFSSLAAKGLRPRALSRRAAVEAGCTLPGIEEIILPGFVDVKAAFEKYLAASRANVRILVHADAGEGDVFDEWGRPATFFSAKIALWQVKSAPTAVVEADDIARHFREVRADEALPALAVCDSSIYPELEGAFQNRFGESELVLRNPSKEPLATSALGRIVLSLERLSRTGDYETFSTFVRTGDAARWAAREFGVDAATVAEWTGALDAVQNARLPRTIDEAIEGAAAEAESARRESERAAAAGLKRLAEKVRESVPDTFGFLKRIFSSLVLDASNPSDRELFAAAETVRNVRADCASEAIPESLRGRIFEELLENAFYMLEPVAPNILAADGWLELPWCEEDEVVLAGFNEGCVPENIVGHPFVPDSLRARLGLATNERRAMRDAFIFAEALRCRAPGGVRVHLHQMSGDGNVMKPSRILFNGVDDEALPQMAKDLYAVTKGNEGAPAKELPPAWRLRLPFPPEGTIYRKRMSPTALDGYLRCPFGFYLAEVFGESSDDRNRELDALAFGNLCHEALDAFAKRGPKDSTDAREIARFLEEAVREDLARFGNPLPAVVALQGEAAIARLEAFSLRQAERRKAGWRIVASERNFTCTIKGCPTVLSGRIDRMDEHEATGELAIIDYKTWDRATLKGRDSLQLPIYRAMVEASGLFPADKARSAEALYCILAERQEDVVFDTAHACREGMQSDAEDRAVELLGNIAKGIFYPPANNDWQEKYGMLVWESPEKGIDPAWLEDQAARRGAK